jgi:hypothetical protein
MKVVGNVKEIKIKFVVFTFTRRLKNKTKSKSRVKRYRDIENCNPSKSLGSDSKQNLII